jgi:hypothetical protein
MTEKNNSSILSKLVSEAGLVLIPFFFTLIVFMSQVGKFYFYDIPLEHISISLGELFSFWFGFFIAVGVIGFTLIDVIVGTIRRGKLEKFCSVVLFEPFLFFLITFLVLFPIAPFKVTVILSVFLFISTLLITLGEAWIDKNKQLSFWERILSNCAKAKYQRIAKSTDSKSWWDKVNESYYLGFFFAYIILGFPCKIGYLIESTKTRHWVDASQQELVVIQTQNEFHLLKEYDPNKKTFKTGYVIRPIDSELKYVEIETGEIKKIGLN